MSGSDIAQIVDYTTLVAARIQGVTLPNGAVAGVRSVWGAGQNFYPDPFDPSIMVRPAQETPVETFQHISEVPDAPTITPETQDGTVKIVWDVPMRLILARGDLATTRQIALPFYDAYLGAFWADRRLGDLAALAYIRSFARGGDGTWAWLEMTLQVTEYVRY